MVLPTTVDIVVHLRAETGMLQVVLLQLGLRMHMMQVMSLHVMVVGCHGHMNTDTCAVTTNTMRSSLVVGYIGQSET